MSPQRRTALVSVGAACLLIAIKLTAGLASGSLGLLAEAAHSGTDLAAALLTFFAVSVAVRPADRGHPFGHGKAQNLAALAEATFLIGISLLIAGVALARLTGSVESEVDATWWTFAAIALVIAIDASRTVVSLRAGRQYRSDALLANALHFASDLAGTIAVLIGLSAAALGFPSGDAIAALFVAGLVIVAAGQLLRRNVNVLMDRSPVDAEAAARGAIASLDPPVELRRLRVREAGGAHFADVVIGIAPGAAVGQGHAAADRVEEALREHLPDADVVVHVEPHEADAELRERVLAAALGVPRVRELHNLTLLEVDGRLEVSLHLKLPGDLPLEQAHDIAEEVERAILAAVPEVADVRTHLEPWTEADRGTGGRRRRRRGRARRPRGDGSGSPRASLRADGRGHRRVPHARARGRRVARRRPHAGERDRGAGAPGRSGNRRRRHPHGALVARMRLCMFHPLEHPLERGWVGRVDGEHVTQLAAQTLQSFFTGGGLAREHAVYPLAAVRFLAPVLHPPSVRVFEEQDVFAFGNPAAIVSPGASVRRARGPAAARRRRRRRGRARRVHAARGVAPARPVASEGPRLRARARPRRRHPGRARPERARGRRPRGRSGAAARPVRGLRLGLGARPRRRGHEAPPRRSPRRSRARHCRRRAGSSVELEVDGIGVLGQAVAS